jgi:D-alanyl-D-alanine-carboxypeptidase/D-alanyl-D-alanine-endopeptidase
MSNVLLRYLTFSFVATLSVGGVALAEDRALKEATAFTGTIMYLEGGMPGLVFGAVRNGETALAGFGEIRDGSGIEPDGDSIFRLASVSKVFCGAVLGALALEGKVGLTDPLQTLIGPGATVPTKDGRTLRLIDLVTQTSGLPWDVPRPRSPPEDPFASNTTEAQLAAIQDGDPFLFAPGTAAVQSNFGFDLLGLALANAAGRPYADMLREEVLDPLGMADTTMNPPADAKGQMMQGHGFDGSPLPNVPSSAGIECGDGLHSTGADMLRFIAWSVDRNGDDLRALRQLTQAAHVWRDSLAMVYGVEDAGTMDAMGLGWSIVFPDGNRPLILAKSGAIEGFMTYVVIAPTRGVGAFFAMNAFNIAAHEAAVAATNAFVASLAPR